MKKNKVILFKYILITRKDTNNLYKKATTIYRYAVVRYSNNTAFKVILSTQKKGVFLKARH